MWLSGDTSTTSGKILARFLDANAIKCPSAAIDRATASGLDYDPLLTPGERFPVMNAELPPHLDPRAPDGSIVQGMLGGTAGIDALGYRRLAELGALPLAFVRRVGGGAGTRLRTAMRARRLGVPLVPAASVHAAVGAARLAPTGVRGAGNLR